MSVEIEETSDAFTPTCEMTVLPAGYATRPHLVSLFGKSEMFWIRLERTRKGPPVVRLRRTPLYKLSDVLAGSNRSRDQGRPAQEVADEYSAPGPSI